MFLLIFSFYHLIIIFIFPSVTRLFKIVTKEKIEKLMTNLNIKKAFQSNDILAKLVKEFGYLIFKYIAKTINKCITGTFTEVRLIYKKDGETEKSNYRPISVLSNVSKSYERCKFFPILIKYFPKINAVFVKALILKISF